MAINTESQGIVPPKLRTNEAPERRVQSKARPDRAALAQRIRHQQASMAQTNTESKSSEPKTLTLKGLLKAWGLSDSNYDFNDDGTVNVQDLLRLLSNGGEMPNPNSKPEAPVSTPGEPANSTNDTADEQPTVITVKSMMRAYGSDNAEHDLNGDGSVGVQDLLKLLNNGGEMRIASGEQNDENQPNDGNENDSEQTFTVTTEGVLKAYNSSNELFDLNADGTVNVQDLLRVLSHGGELRITVPNDENNDAPADELASRRASLRINTDNLTGTSPNDQANGPANASDLLNRVADNGRVRVTPEAPVSTASGFDGIDSQDREQQMNQLSTALIDGFEQAGFASKPPANLPDLLSRFDLSQQDRTSLLSQIRQRYPEGLGLNLYG